MKVTINGERLDLTSTEFKLLSLLVTSDGTSQSREHLLQEVWGYAAAISTHTLETHIYRLRRKIEADPADAKILVTDDGGYRLAP